MRIGTAIAALAALFFGTPAQMSRQYWLLLKGDGRTWCGYTDNAEFMSDVKNLGPTETARATYTSGVVSEATYQVEPESGDWVVVDKYTPSSGGLVLRRANLLTQENLQIIEEATIHAGKAGSFRTLSTTTLDGKKPQAPDPSIDLPTVPIRTSFADMPYVTVAAEMQKQSVSKLCKAF